MAESEKLNFNIAIKDIFDHFRNYLITASIFCVGLVSLSHPEWHGLGDFGRLVSFLVVFIAVILFLLNIWQVVWFIMKNFRPVKLSGMNRKKGYFLGISLIILYFSFVYVIIIISINLQLPV
ncbi:MAG: hypothetical protein DU489_12860 [Nitrosomonas sp.]